MIKTIIFDFGDVFVNLDKAATQRELQALNITNLSEVIYQKNLLYEKGLISSDEFVSSYLKEYPHLNAERIIDSWNSILVDFPTYRLKFLKQLSEENEYKLILLSNTNEIHINWITENVSFYNEFKSYFDAFYLSHEINYRKPNADIYEFVLKQHQLEAAECLFIDDTKANTDTAKELGFHVWNIEPATQDVIDLFTVKKELF